MVSAFGSTDAPTSSGQDPTQLAQSLASFVINNGLDGIDIDYEDFDAISAGTAVNWLVEFTQALRNELPAGQFLISHAPVAPWYASLLRLTLLFLISCFQVLSFTPSSLP